MLVLARAKVEYSSLFEALEGDATIVLVSVGAVIFIVIIFTFARVYTAYLQAGDALVIAEKEAARLKEVNLRIKDQLNATGLNPKQASMIKANAGNIETKISIHFKLDWKFLKFTDR